MPEHGESMELEDRLVGRVFAERYRIEGVLGCSTMSTIYRAVDTTSERTVAVNLLSHQLADKETLTRFNREAQIARTITHSNVVQFLDHGVTAENAPFYVLALFDGQLLSDILAESGGLDPVQAVEMLIAVCRGMQYLHSRGIVLRDLRPANLMVQKAASQVTVKITDLGIAKGTVGGAHQSMELMVAAGSCDSLLYMAPELLSGQPGDARCDIYSLGCIMYQTLTGADPFGGAGPERIIESHQHGNPPALRTAGLPPRLALLLQPIVSRCLEKLPEHRYQTVGELKDAIERIEGSVTLAWSAAAEHASSAGGRRLAMSITGAIIGVCLAALMWAIFLIWEMYKSGLFVPR